MPTLNRKSLLILGTRGIPAAHGGFETFAERFALYMVAHGWEVTVYCQKDVKHKSATPISVDEWRGVRRVNIENDLPDAIGTMMFDWASIRHAMREPGLPLVLGYNTALFTLPLRLSRRPVLMNMDGIEWKRAKWGIVARMWLFINEQFGARISTRLIADHPVIADHLATIRRRDHILTIPYGADAVADCPESGIWEMGLERGRYFISIGRIEPENSILEMITAFAAEPRLEKFVCLGNMQPDTNPYHRRVIEAAQGRVLFPGAIYNKARVQALRRHALAYCHGHTVGGTNPSLVEALGAGSAVIAHKNKFNQWVAGPEQLFFTGIPDCRAAFDRALSDPAWVSKARLAAAERFAEEFTWEKVLSSYEELCLRSIGKIVPQASNP